MLQSPAAPRSKSPPKSRPTVWFSIPISRRCMSNRALKALIRLAIPFFPIVAKLACRHVALSVGDTLNLFPEL